ncbi:hypothetical protein [Nocardioides sp. YIM 152315]|uniref:hypothetical protein n=1 Tax=Nocardioides sp. YIM 152315 TaxID=3031760 RepID=UPI0023DBAB5F|nr:hypothetical protein [Nocardioides sp. YIM 152315]MDF1605618.1 hypothetical protein [Nocardioides sp. YIM 152315]
MNDAQTWTLIGGFFALVVAMIALVLRTVRAELSVVNVKLDHLDRDVQALTDRLMRGRE